MNITPDFVIRFWSNCRVRSADAGPARDTDRGRKERGLRSLALAGVGAAHLLLRLLEHPPLRWRFDQRELDSHRRTLRGRVSVNEWAVPCPVLMSKTGLDLANL